MGIEHRLRRLERSAHAAIGDTCPQCNGFIILEEIAEDGTVTYPHGEPCPACGSWASEGSASGRIGRITVSQAREDPTCLGPEDGPEEFLVCP